MNLSEIRWFSPVKTKWGVFCLEGTKQGVFRVIFPKGKATGVCSRERKPGTIFEKYFKEPDARLKFKLDLSGFTVFEKKVYQALCRVKPGKVISYGALAKRAGFPGAARAVGSAMRKRIIARSAPSTMLTSQETFRASDADLLSFFPR